MFDALHIVHKHHRAYKMEAERGIQSMDLLAWIPTYTKQLDAEFSYLPDEVAQNVI